MWISKETKFDYEKAVEIDEYNLDVEWRKQAQYVYACMVQLAEAKREADRLKEDMDITKAELDRGIREQATSKLTERSIENLILTDARVREIQRQLTEARYYVNMLEAARVGLDTKRAALESLVKLHGMGYFAEPTADIIGRGELDDMQTDRVRNKILGRKSKETGAEKAPKRTK